MTIIGGAIGAYSDAGDDPALALSRPSPVDVIANDPTVERIYLLIATPYDPVTAAEITVYISSAPFTSDPTDTPALVQFKPRLRNPYNVQNQLFEEGRPIAGTSIPGFGAKTILNGDGLFDDWVGYEWSGRTLKTYLTTPGRTLAESAQIAESKASSLSWDLDQLTIPVRDFRLLLQKPINTTLYAGTGGLEGGDALKSKPKPRVWGRFFNEEPVLVDGTTHTYQINDGSIQEITAVKDRGVSLSFDQDVADITTVTPVPGEYATSLATGYIKLGEAPDGTLTVDGKGNNGGTLGYKEDPAGIIRKIATEDLPFVDPDDLDTGAFQDTSAAVPEPVGYSTRLDQVDGIVAFSSIAGTMIHVTFTRLGKLTVGQIVEPSTATAGFSLTEDDLREPSAGGTFGGSHQLAVKQTRLGYNRYGKTLSPTDVAGSVSENDRQDFGEEFRFEEDEDGTVVVRVPEAKVLEETTRLALSADAAAEATRVLTLLSPTRHLYQAQLETGLFRYFLGDIVQITINRFDLVSGKNFVVLGFVENAGEYGQSDQIILTLWG